MSKKAQINKITSILSISLRHKIGAIVNSNELYAQKYSKDAEMLFREAEKLVLREKWNNKDKAKIKEQLEKKLKKELEEKDFLDNKKFELMGEEIDGAMRLLDL